MSLWGWFGIPILGIEYWFDTGMVQYTYIWGNNSSMINLVPSHMWQLDEETSFWD